MPGYSYLSDNPTFEALRLLWTVVYLGRCFLRADSQHNAATVADLRKYLPAHAEADAGLLLAILSVYQAYFHRLHSKITHCGKHPFETDRGA